MAEAFVTLSANDRREALAVAADRSGRPAHLLEKDVWVVWTLATLFGSNFGEHLVFKGGTSLSKAYHVIRRFSEDVDLTYDIRAIAPDLVGENGEGLPKNRSEEKRWSKAVRHRLPEWVDGTVRPLLARAIDAQSLPATFRAEGDKLFIDYEATSSGSGYVAPSVMLEFGARSTGEPASPRDVVCDAAGLVDGVEFPTARPGSCMPSEPSGRKRRQCMFIASRAGCGAIGSPVIGTMSSDWMMRGSPTPQYRIVSSPTRLPATKPCSSGRRRLMARLSTTKPPSVESCNSCRTEMRALRWQRTMRTWSRMGCCLTTRNPSRR